MTDIDNFGTSWQGLTHGQVEDAIKAKVTQLDSTKLDDSSDVIQQLVSAASSAYHKEPTGIPKTDLAPSVQTSLGLADTALQAADKTQLQAAINAVQTALNNLMNGQNVTDAIDTFNEVVDFLNGIDTDDQTLFNQLLALSNAITDLQTALAGKISGIKANGASTTLPVDPNGIVELPPAGSTISPATVAPSMDGTAAVGSSAKYAREDHVHPKDTSKQDTLTFDDAPGNTDNPVKSRGIKTAIDVATPTISPNGKWIIGGVETDVDARGPRGNTVLVNENSQGIQALIVNNVVDGGETDILSAEMGKVIRIAVMTIFNALSPYAFTNGKPIISWGSTAIKHDISANGVTGGLTISDIYVDNESVAEMPLQILDNKSLSFKLNLPNDAYIFNGVAITMGGIDITENSGVWDETTGIVTIANVTGAVVVVATTATYVQDSLVFNLDCRQGVTLDANDVPTKWTDQKGNIEFDLTDVTQNSDGALVFNGSTSKGVSNSSLNVSFNNATVEVVAEADTYENNEYNPVLSNTIDGGSCAVIRRRYSSDRQSYYIVCANACNGTGLTGTPLNMAFSLNNKLNFAFGATRNAVVIDGVEQSDPRHEVNGVPVFDVNDFTGRISTVLGVGYMNSSQTTPAETFFAGKILAIRVYTSKLTPAQMQANYAIDKKRFNLQ